MMKNAHPTLPTARGVYSNEHDTLVLYPSANEGTIPQETTHIWFEKNFGFPCPTLPCSKAEIKKYGVDEGFAKIVAHRVAGVAPADAPSADNVKDILAGTFCSALGNATRAAGCAHDLGNLVFEAYERVASDLGADVAFDVYRKAMRKLKGGVVSPATLHKRVREMLADRYRREMEDPPLDPDPFALDDWFRVLVEWGIPIVEVP